MNPEFQKSWMDVRRASSSRLSRNFATTAIRAAESRRRRLRSEYRAVFSTAVLCVLLCATWNWAWGNREQERNWRAWNQFLSALPSSDSQQGQWSTAGSGS